MRRRFLTKSLFKVAYECPTKLYYQTRASEYGNNNTDDAFLASLAEGGFQVGELAKLYFPGGIGIDTLDSIAALARTEELLRQENVTIYEAALRHGDCLVRVDVLRKTGTLVELIEVKAKSFDSAEEDAFYNKRELKKGAREIHSVWMPYLVDVAYQTWVARQALPGLSIEPYLMMADKGALASVDGLNQMFLISSERPGGRTGVIVAPGIGASDLGDQILIAVPVADEIEVLLGETEYAGGRSFVQLVEHLLEHFRAGTRPEPVVGAGCKGCEFRIPREMKAGGIKSGFEECWNDSGRLGDADTDTDARAWIFEIWNFKKTQKLLDEGVLFMDQVQEEDIGIKPSEDDYGLSQSERQWLQIEKSNAGDTTPFVDTEALRAEMASWQFPLHFIDFETTRVAIPFNAGRRPYEQIAFQFSHHMVHEDGSIEHKTQYINRERGLFPNFDFVRELRRALSQDNGTIFRYAPHENTVLREIHEQLERSQEPDRIELCAWIDTITEDAPRSMVDLCKLVKKFYYHPLTRGSNSIKDVLPAILQESRFLQTKYSRPVYGSDPRLTSRNFRNHAWIQFEADGRVKDPYKILEPIFSDLDLETMDRLIKENSLADGGAAMTAYARMQFTEMTDREAERVSVALLRYCELDTLAMVMICEYWRELVGIAQNQVRVASGVTPRR